MSSPVVTVTGRFKGRDVTLTWDRGRVSGTDDEALDELATLAAVWEGHSLKLEPAYCVRATLTTPHGFALLARGTLDEKAVTEGLEYPPIPPGAIP